MNFSSLSYKSKFKRCENMPVSAAIHASCLSAMSQTRPDCAAKASNASQTNPFLLFISEAKIPHCINIPRRTTWSLQIKIFTYFLSFQASFPLQFSHHIKWKKKCSKVSEVVVYLPTSNACPLSCSRTRETREMCSMANLNMTSDMGALLIKLYSSR